MVDCTVRASVQQEHDMRLHAAGKLRRHTAVEAFVLQASAETALKAVTAVVSSQSMLSSRFDPAGNCWHLTIGDTAPVESLRTDMEIADIIIAHRNPILGPPDKGPLSRFVIYDIAAGQTLLVWEIDHL